ncbi:MAG TPA: AAA family ATPase, partial [Candidatus Nitrosopolaris rasttigaisensis]|nr:AAA family ATPase [Candidatus Nitrosopolaris rasttigaisensis]
MIFERIALVNFRQYFDRQRLEFAKDRQRKVTVIHGVNGAGKTSLLRAINWCLYGSEYIDKVGELISKEAISRVEVSESVTMSVELSFLHDGDRYIVKRSLRGIKMIDANVQSDLPDEFTMVHMHEDGQSEQIKNPIGTINTILPSNIRSYFLFDGEQIDEFAKPESSKQVKHAIYHVFRLETLDNARKSLEAVATDYRRELKDISSGELGRIADEEQKARTELERSENEQQEAQEEKESVRRKMKDIEEQLGKMKSTNELQDRHDRIIKDTKQRRKELEDVTSLIRDISTCTYFSIIPDTVKNALLFLETKREKGGIPANIKQQFVRDLINQKQCICGRPLTENCTEYIQLLSLINATPLDSLEDDVLTLSATLRMFEERANNQSTHLGRQMKRRIELLNLILDLDTEADDVRYRLKASPLEEVSGLEKQRQLLQADMDNYTMTLGALNERIEKLNKYLVQLGKELLQAQKNDRKQKLLTTKLNLAQQGADAIKGDYQGHSNIIRQEVETKTKEIFRRLSWKDGYFQSIKIDKDFSLEIIDQYGKQARPDLSTGERQILSLSFITAMACIREEEAPLIIDTPFGYLSTEHRSNVTKYLPDLCDQLVLLVTDEELHSQARANLEPHIGN